MKKITSRDNPTFRLLHALAESGRERRKRERTLLDGIHLVATYTERLGPPELIAVSEHGKEQPEIAAFLRTQPRTDLVLFGDGLFNEISPVATPTGIIALIPLPESSSRGQTGKSWVLLDAVQDAGNLGSILRTAAAAGISDVFLGPGCAQAWSPRVLRAGMGAHFALGIHEHASLEEVLRGFVGTTVSTSLKGGTAVYDIDLRDPVAWVFGGEGPGLSPELEALAGHVARIPMPGSAESLNVSAAAAVCLFEEVRQKAQSAAS